MLDSGATCGVEEGYGVLRDHARNLRGALKAIRDRIDADSHFALEATREIEEADRILRETEFLCDE